MSAPKNLGKAIEAGYRPMFMTPGEVTEHYTLGDSPMLDRSSGPKSAEQKSADKETLAQKLTDAKHTQSQGTTESLYNSIKNEGVQSSIKVGHSRYIGRPVLSDGHHRLAVSSHLNPSQFLAVEY